MANHNQKVANCNLVIIQKSPDKSSIGESLDLANQLGPNSYTDIKSFSNTVFYCNSIIDAPMEIRENVRLMLYQAANTPDISMNDSLDDPIKSLAI